MLWGWLRLLAVNLRPAARMLKSRKLDFKGRLVAWLAKFKRNRRLMGNSRFALNKVGVCRPVIKDSTDKTDEVLIKVPLNENTDQAPPPEIEPGARAKAKETQGFKLGARRLKRARYFRKEARRRTVHNSRCANWLPRVWLDSVSTSPVRG